MKSRTAILAIVAFVVIATVSAALAVRMLARSIDETAAAQAAEAPELAHLYIAKFGSLAAAAPTIIKRVMRAGLHVSIVDFKTNTQYSARGAFKLHPGSRGPESRGFFAGLPPGAPPSAPPGEPGRPGGPGGPPDLSDAHPRPIDGGSPRRFIGSLLIASLTGETIHYARLPGGFIEIFPAPEPILAVVQTVGAALSFVFAASGAMVWLYVRAVRRAALRPLYETTLALQRLASRDFTPRTITAGEGGAYAHLAQAYNAAVEAVSSAFAERRAAESEMQRFIADAGHELRTPLTIVMGYLDIIDGGALADPKLAARIISGMRTESVRMRKLIEKLIVLARMETPSDIDARTNIDVVALAQRVIESLEPLTLLSIDVSGLPFAHVFANEDDVAEALTNIFENGLKYAPASRIDVTVERSADTVVIGIADVGPGMSTEEQRNAFERFYRGEKRGEVSGSGLGLAIAKRAIERSRGTIRLHSIVGVGTTFTIELPELPGSGAESRRSQLAHR